MRSWPAKALTNIRSVERGKWKLVISRSTTRNWKPGRIINDVSELPARTLPCSSTALSSARTTVVPTAKQYKDDNPYNTYLHDGLPAGPISSPGDAAIAAALHPATGKWLYFVTVNLQTGETVFSNTLAEHDKAAAEFTRWLKAHPDYAK